MLRKLTIAAAVAVMPIAFSSAAVAEVVLRAQTGLPKQHDLSVSFIEGFVNPLNEAGKGIVQVEYVGGPEVTPPDKAAPALQRGVFDVLHTPAAYHVGIVPHGRTFMSTNLTPSEYRANGAFDMLAPHWEKNLNAKIIGIGETAAQFHLYLVNKPELTDEGVIDLRGKRIRTTGAYRALAEGLGATPVQITNAGEVYTALERGVVEGFGWPTVGLNRLGLAKFVNYRIDPPFYNLANLVLVNKDKWDSLSQEAQDILMKVGAEYEEASREFISNLGQEDFKGVQEAGVEIFEMPEEGARKYLEIAYEAQWKAAAERVEADELAALREKMYQVD